VESETHVIWSEKDEFLHKEFPYSIVPNWTEDTTASPSKGGNLVYEDSTTGSFEPWEKTHEILKSLQYSRSSYDRNREKFFQLKSSQSAGSRYWNRYVAIVGENIVDDDSDERTLVSRVYQRFGYLSLYIGKVEETQTTEDISTPDVE
jgi:hypothetical protein